MKKLMIAGALAGSLAGCAVPDTQAPSRGKQQPASSTFDFSDVSPGLSRYSHEYVDTTLWQRPGLSARDRSIATISVLISRNQVVPLELQLNRALDNGVMPAELSEILTHLAFYGGWGNAQGAALVMREVFARRGIEAGQLPAAQGGLLPLDERSEAARATMVGTNFGTTSPGVVQNTTDLLFRDLWLRPGLSPRDRSLVTVSSLIGNGQVAQLSPHLNRAMDNGLTQPEASEVLTQLAFYAGWPNAFSALPVFKDVFAKRAQ